MKRIIRKGASLILFMAMVINSFSYLPIYAQENNVGNEDTTTQIEDSENNAEESIPSEDTLSSKEGEGSISMNEESAQETKTSDNVVIADEEPISAPIPGDTSLVNYFYVGYPYLKAPSTQEFVLSFGNGTENISKIVLKYQKDNGNLVELQSTKQSGELYVFNNHFSESDTGTYKVIGFSYFIDSQEYTINFSDLEMDVRFGVNQEYDGFGENEGYTIDENGNEIDEVNEVNDSIAQEIDSSVVSLDGSNVSNTEELVESVLKQNAQTPQNKSRRKRSITTYSESNPLVICIDPGHGGSESGTVVVDGSLEKNMNLKIAMYLKEELEQYKNVKVVMTRTSDVYVSLQDRAKIAANAGATALVSIHINATGWGTQSSVSGAEVYYPHANYNAAVSETGKNLAQNILNELVGLGLNNLGIKVKYVYDTNTGEPAHDPAYDYPDDSVGDYYGVIRYSKELGVAGIIVEHAMSDNWSDFNNFLSSDAKLKNLGIADATGIAKAFGLMKDTWSETKILHKNDFAGTFDVQVKHTGHQKIALKIWSNERGEAYAKKYTPVSISDGVYQLSYQISEQNGVKGKYTIETYIDNELKSTITCSMSKSIAELNIANENNKDIKFIPSLTISDVPEGMSDVLFAVWSAKGGQDDLIWYSGQKATQNGWMTNVELKNHMDYGIYNVHAYVQMDDGYMINVGTDTFEIKKPTGQIHIENQDNQNGSFDVVMDHIESNSGVSLVQIPVWTVANGQDDIQWYTAEKQADGTYRVTVTMANHNYETGKYQVTAYITGNNGLRAGIGSISTEVKVSKPNLRITNINDTKVELELGNPGVYGNVVGVQFAVWSEENGQDDLKWIGGIQRSNGKWTADINIKDYYSYGKYNVHVYITLASGSQKGILTDTFEIKKPTGQIHIENQDNQNGSFDVVMDHIESNSGV
ncbi:GBS Bsp-like repeat-containing protein, partial [Faecalicoccus pleomorphus]|uniref:GBS Bsp-like repeat-containing protein n=1 Tax=Faecalicoccus pleomorphus TaxID=1323 RepID=UPI0018977E65